MHVLASIESLLGSIFFAAACFATGYGLAHLFPMSYIASRFGKGSK